MNILILSDRGIKPDQAAIPALLAVSGLHHHLIRNGKRTQVTLILESGEPREVHHFAVLIGYGASAINPYLALRDARGHDDEGMLGDVDLETAVYNYRKALIKGVVKTISKMGISTIQSYCGAQIFEALGLKQSFVDRYFTWTPTRVEGIGIDEVARRGRAPASQGVPERAHPTAAFCPRAATTSGDRTGNAICSTRRPFISCSRPCAPTTMTCSRRYSTLVNDQTREACTLRGLLDFKFADEPIPLDEVEPVESIVKRFKTGAMSYGSISKEAHEALAIAMNRIGGKSNTGEGGEDPARYIPEPNGDIKQQRHQAGGFGPLRRHQPISGECQRTADQDGAGRQAGRGRATARTQGVSLDRQGALLDSRRGADLAAPAPRHLFHRGSGGADPRPEERQPPRAHQREAGGGSGRGHDCRRRGQRSCRRDPDQRA